MQAFDRRNLLRLVYPAFILGCAEQSVKPARTVPHTTRRLADLEQYVGGRVGVYAIAKKGVIAHRAHERFALCSTFKWGLAAEVLRRADQGELSLSTCIPFGEDDLQPWAPITRPRVQEGAMRIDELAEAAVSTSDNTATNLLLARLGGPSVVTGFFRGLGDDKTRLDRPEPELNENLVGDPRDTTTPSSMALALRTTLTESILSSHARHQLTTWLEQSQVGLDRLRAGFRPGTRAGNKTGTGGRGAVNDVAVLWPASGGVLFVASYLSGSAAPLSRLIEAQATIGRLVETTLA